MKEHLKKCPPREYLETYVDFPDELSDEELFEIEEHLYDCDSCTELVREMCRFNKAWEQWTAASYQPEGEPLKVSSLIPKTMGAIKGYLDKNTSLISFMLQAAANKDFIASGWNFSYAGIRGPDNPIKSEINIARENGDELMTIRGFNRAMEVKLEGFGLDCLPDITVLTGDGIEIIPEITEAKWSVKYHFADIPEGQFTLFIKLAE